MMPGSMADATGRPLLVDRSLDKEPNVVAVGAVDGGDNRRYPRPLPVPVSTGDVRWRGAGVGWLCAAAAPSRVVRTFSPALSRLFAGSPELFPRVLHSLCAYLVVRMPIDHD
jgi:hypothetical protein